MQTALYGRDHHDIQKDVVHHVRSRPSSPRPEAMLLPSQARWHGCETLRHDELAGPTAQPLKQSDYSCMDTSGLRISPRSPLALVSCYPFGTHAQEPFSRLSPSVSSTWFSVRGAVFCCGLAFELSGCSRHFSLAPDQLLEVIGRDIRQTAEL